MSKTNYKKKFLPFLVCRISNFKFIKWVFIPNCFYSLNKPNK